MVERERIVQRQITVPNPPVQPVQKPVAPAIQIPSMSLGDSYSDEDWGEDSYIGKGLNVVKLGVLKIKGATMSYKLFSEGERTYYNGDKWWFSVETKAENQMFVIYN